MKFLSFIFMALLLVSCGKDDDSQTFFPVPTGLQGNSWTYTEGTSIETYEFQADSVEYTLVKDGQIVANEISSAAITSGNYIILTPGVAQFPLATLSFSNLTTNSVEICAGYCHVFTR